MGTDPTVGPPRTAADLVGLALAAGAGTRLAPLTWERPKVLCPVDGVALLDLALARLRPTGAALAVNAHHHLGQIEAHLGARGDRSVHLSIEQPEALGTAGAIGHLRRWIDGRDVLVTNADSWSRADLATFVRGWDGQRVRVLLAGAREFGPRVDLVATLLPAPVVSGLDAVPSGLYEVVLRDEAARGNLEVCTDDGPFVDCGTPARYLAANLLATGGHSSIGADAVVRGSVRESVVWDGATVHEHERLVRAVRTSAGRTVLVR